MMSTKPNEVTGERMTPARKPGRPYKNPNLIPQAVADAWKKAERDRDQYKAQRDELLAALRDIMAGADEPYSIADVRRLSESLRHNDALMTATGRIASVARAAIARAEGRADDEIARCGRCGKIKPARMVMNEYRCSTCLAIDDKENEE